MAGSQQVRDGVVELGLVYDHSGGTAPSQTFRLLRLEKGRWRSLWDGLADGLGEWKQAHGQVSLAAGGADNGEPLAEVTLRASSWLFSLDGRGAFFHESNPGPHRWFTDTWRREGDVYVLASSRVDPTAYATLVEFVYRLSRGDHERAAELVADPVLVTQAIGLGLDRRPANPSWLIDLNSPEVEVRGPITIVDGPPATFTFRQQDDRWVITDIRRNSG